MVETDSGGMGFDYMRTNKDACLSASREPRTLGFLGDRSPLRARAPLAMYLPAFVFKNDHKTTHHEFFDLK